MSKCILIGYYSWNNDARYSIISVYWSYSCVVRAKLFLNIFSDANKYRYDHVAAEEKENHDLIAQWHETKHRLLEEQKEWIHEKKMIKAQISEAKFHIKEKDMDIQRANHQIVSDKINK